MLNRRPPWDPEPERVFKIFEARDIVMMILGGYCSVLFLLTGVDLLKGRVENFNLAYLILSTMTLILPYISGVIFFKTWKLTLKKYALCLMYFVIFVLCFGLLGYLVVNFKI